LKQKVAGSSPAQRLCEVVQWFYSSFTVDTVNPGKHLRTQNGLGKRLLNTG
jgi:hypothetical protein